MRQRSTKPVPVNLGIGAPYEKLVASKERARSAIAESFGLPPTAVFPAIGATEAIQRVASLVESTTLPGRRAVIAVPEYWRAVQRVRQGFDVAPFAMDVRQNYALQTGRLNRHVARVKPALVYLSHPHNPTGRLYDVEGVIERLPASTTLLVDTTLLALHENAAHDMRAQVRDWLVKHPGKRIAVVGSVSKTHDAAPLRFGWILATHPSLQHELESRDLLFPTPVSLERGSRLLGRPFSRAALRRIARSHALIERHAKRLGYETLPSSTRSAYALIRFEASKIRSARKRLKDARVQVLYGKDIGLAGHFVRVETGNPESVQRFLDALGGRKARAVKNP